MNNHQMQITNQEVIALFNVLQGNNPDQDAGLTPTSALNVLGQKLSNFMTKAPTLAYKYANEAGNALGFFTAQEYNANKTCIEGRLKQKNRLLDQVAKESAVKNVIDVIADRVEYINGQVQYRPIEGKLFDDLNKAAQDIVKSINSQGKIHTTMYISKKQTQSYFKNHIEQSKSDDLVVGAIARITRWTMEKLVMAINYAFDKLGYPEYKIKNTIKVPQFIKKNSSFADRIRIEALELKTQQHLLHH